MISSSGKVFNDRYFLWVYSVIVLLSIFIFFFFNSPVIILILILIGIIPIVIYKPELTYYALFFSIPISVELYFGSLGTDFPSELLMILVSGIIILFMIKYLRQIDGHFFIHPFTISLYLLMSWMIFTGIWANDTIISLKFILAKSWYILPFFIGPLIFCNSLKKMNTVIMMIAIPLTVSVIIALIRHGMKGFSFMDTNSILGPAFRNHVIYAALIVIFLPFLLFLRSYQKNRKSIVLFMVAGILLIGLYFSFTRAAYVAFFGMCGMYLIIRGRLIKPVLLAGTIVPIIGILFILPNNTYLDFAPDFQKTIVHYEFDDLISATARGEDASTMERVYRWVAAYQMIKERPVLGFGPGNFYSSYKPYALTMFRTYVSDNEDKSGIHSYYLMTLVEQGFIGLLIFLSIIIIFYVKAEEIYHREFDPRIKALIMSCILSFTAIAILQLLNDLIETDKTGSFFFFCLSIVVLIDLKLMDFSNDTEGSITS